MLSQGKSCGNDNMRRLRQMIVPNRKVQKLTSIRKGQYGGRPTALTQGSKRDSIPPFKFLGLYTYLLVVFVHDHFPQNAPVHHPVSLYLHKTKHIDLCERLFSHDTGTNGLSFQCQGERPFSILKGKIMCAWIFSVTLGFKLVSTSFNTPTSK